MAKAKSNAEALEYCNRSPEIKSQAVHFFNSMDRNGDGSITKREFSRFIKQSKFLSKWIDPNSMFAELDKDNSGKLNFDEFTIFVHKVFTWSVCEGCSQKCYQDMPHLTCVKCFREGRWPFDLCSSCHSKKEYKHIHNDFQDFRQLVCKYVSRLEKFGFRKHAENVAQTSSGVSMASEKSNAEALEFHKKSPQIKAQAACMFNFIDLDGDGIITKKEFSFFLRKNKFLVKWTEHNNMFADLDKDSNGKLDFDEFLTFVHKVITWYVCDGCGQELDQSMPRLTCAKCFLKNRRTFDLCHSCHSEKKYVHKHDNFQEFGPLLCEFVAQMEKNDRRLHTACSTNLDIEMIFIEMLLAFPLKPALAFAVLGLKIAFDHRNRATLKAKSAETASHYAQIASDVAMARDKSHSEALEYYYRSPQVKAQASRIFKFMDTNGDGTIGKKEFSSFLQQNNFLSKCTEYDNMFVDLDKDNSGELDFDEFITFVHKVFTWTTCDGCGQELEGGMPRLTCTNCFRKGKPPFDLCSSCHSEKTYEHQHDDFQEFVPLLCQYLGRMGKGRRLAESGPSTDLEMGICLFEEAVGFPLGIWATGAIFVSKVISEISTSLKGPIAKTASNVAQTQTTSDVAIESKNSIAEDLYNKSPEIRDHVASIFELMDTNEDGAIVKKEFTHFLEKSKFMSKWKGHDNMFADLDKDNSGELDYIEFINLVHKVFTWSVCDGCGQELDQGMPHLTCAKCFREEQHPFDLCSSCHSEKKYEHQHDDFQEFGSLVCEYVGQTEKG